MHFLVSARSHDPEKMSFNFSSHDLSDDEKSLLCKGLNFSIPPKRLDYADHMLPFEFLFSDIDENEMPNEVKEFLKIRLKDSAFTSFQSYNYNSEINLTRNERLALKISAIIRTFHSKIWQGQHCCPSWQRQIPWKNVQNVKQQR